MSLFLVPKKYSLNRKIVSAMKKYVKISGRGWMRIRRNPENAKMARTARRGCAPRRTAPRCSRRKIANTTAQQRKETP
jgi:hypothetical protein